MNDTHEGVEPSIAATNADAPEVSDETTEQKQGAESAPAVKEPDESAELKGIQRRFDELTRNWREAERRESALLELLKQKPQESPAVPAKAKTLEDFEYDTAKFTEYLLNEVGPRATEAARRELQKEQKQVEVRSRFMTFKQKESEFSKGVDDYSDVAHRALISNDVADLVMDLDQGPQVAYYLGKNPEVATAISALPLYRAAVELGRIEAKLGFERDKAKAKTVSTAPPPTPKIDGSGEPAPKVSTTSPESDSMSDDEWVKAERARVARKARRQSA